MRGLGDRVSDNAVTLHGDRGYLDRHGDDVLTSRSIGSRRRAPGINRTACAVICQRRTNKIQGAWQLF